jgi:hypothetical protein
MAQRKQRLTVTVDPELIEAATRAVSAGHASSLSAWVNQALAERAARDRRLQALADAIADYEAQYGRITDEEMAAQRRSDQETAVVVRGGSVGAQADRRRPGKGAA